MTAPLYITNNQSALVTCLVLAFLGLAWCLWHLKLPGTNPGCLSALTLFFGSWMVECTGHTLVLFAQMKQSVAENCSYTAAVLFGVAMLVSVLGVLSYTKNEHRYSRGFLPGVVAATLNGWVCAAMTMAAVSGKFDSIQKGLVVPVLAERVKDASATSTAVASGSSAGRDQALQLAAGHLIGTLVNSLAGSGSGSWSESKVSDDKLAKRVQPNGGTTLATPQGPGWMSVGVSQKSTFQRSALVLAAGASAGGNSGRPSGGGLRLPTGLPEEAASDVLARMNLPQCQDPVAELERIMREAQEAEADPARLLTLQRGTASAGAAAPGTELDASNSTVVALPDAPSMEKAGLTGYTRMGRRGSSTPDSLSLLAELAAERVTQGAHTTERRATTRGLRSGFDTAHLSYVANIPELPGDHLFDHWIALGDDVVLEVVSWTPSLSNDRFRKNADDLVSALLSAATEQGMNGEKRPAAYQLTLEKARAYRESGDLRNSLSQWQQAALILPGDPEPAIAVAELLATADTRAALADLQKRAPALRATPVVAATLVRLREAAGDPTAAADAAELLVRGYRDDAMFALHLRHLADNRAHRLLTASIEAWGPQHASRLSAVYRRAPGNAAALQPRGEIRR